MFTNQRIFISFLQHYLSLCIVGPTQADAQAWAGFVESRLRKLVSDLLSRSLPIKKIQLWPKKIEACIADKSAALLTQAQRQNCITYFIGFLVDRVRMRGDQLNVELPLQNFRDWDLSRFQPLVAGMDILTKHFKVKELPKICFDGMYEGGKEEAMRKRREIRNLDPVRIEKKRLARLQQLKAQMDEINRKKKEQQEKKRKREEADLEVEEAVEKELKREEMSGSNEANDATLENDETDLLANALDTIQEDVSDKKTREEAEVAKEKLLAGELIEEGAAEDADGYESDENAVGYSKDDARQIIPRKDKEERQQHRDKRSLPVSEQVAETLRKLGYEMLGDDEMKVLGTNMIPPWRSNGSAPVEEESFPTAVTIRFREKFDIVELDAYGHVIDKGDNDFMPSKTWTGRRAGFEFKLGARGLGYYRTGQKVVVPSNTAY
jgi:Poly(A) polymerase predicted RNA binding domain